LFARLLRLEFGLKARDLYALLLPGVFLLTFALLFPLALTPESERLAVLAPGICWLATLVSLMLHLDRLFRDDYEQGTLDLLLAGELALLSLVARMLAHWLLIALPLCLLAALLGFTFGMGGKQLLLLVASLASGSAVLVFLGAAIASLCVGASRAGLLIGILLTPLLTPVVIFGVQASRTTGGWELVLLLCGFACINLALAPILCTAALRASMD